MKYQLVIQFPEELFEDIGDVAELEEQIVSYLINDELDGHDIGVGECNIFINTNTPQISSEIVRHILQERMFSLELVKIAYRPFDEEHYLILWPEHLAEFSIS